MLNLLGLKQACLSPSHANLEREGVFQAKLFLLFQRSHRRASAFERFWSFGGFLIKNLIASATFSPWTKTLRQKPC